MRRNLNTRRSPSSRDTTDSTQEGRRKEESNAAIEQTTRSKFRAYFRRCTRILLQVTREESHSFTVLHSTLRQSLACQRTRFPRLLMKPFFLSFAYVLSPFSATLASTHVNLITPFFLPAVLAASADVMGKTPVLAASGAKNLGECRATAVLNLAQPLVWYSDVFLLLIFF